MWLWVIVLPLDVTAVIVTVVPAVPVEQGRSVSLMFADAFLPFSTDTTLPLTFSVTFLSFDLPGTLMWILTSRVPVGTFLVVVAANTPPLAGVVLALIVTVEE